LLFPVISTDGPFLVEILLNSETGFSNNKLEDFLVDADAVNAVFDALTGFSILTGVQPKRDVFISPSSAIDLDKRRCRIAGDSLGLAVLMLLLKDWARDSFSRKKVCAASGALVIDKDKVLCRQVGHLGEKLECVDGANVNVFYCPAQVDAPVNSFNCVTVKQLSAITQLSNFPYFRMEFA